MRYSDLILHRSITSPANPLVKDVRQAIAKAELTAQGFAIAESFHLLEEAERSGIPVEAVLAAERVADRVRTRAKLYVLEDKLFDRLSSTETSQGVIALVRLPQWSFEDMLRDPALIVAIDGVQDPGNCGAIIRSAEAFGASGVVLLKGTANSFHPKTLRASAGSLFRMPFLNACEKRVFEQKTCVLTRFSAQISARLKPETADLTRPCVLIVGSEGRGVSPELAAISEPVSIPTQGVESLNAAVAAGVILYEAQRQRRARLGSV